MPRTPTSPDAAPTRRPGRRAGSPDTRAQIVDVARGLFAERGYDATSLAAIGRAAGVDATLVTHFFGGKSALFAETLDGVRPAFAQVATALEGGRPGLGGRLASAYLLAWESRMRPELLSMLRSASTNPQAREVVLGAIEDLPLRAAQGTLAPDVAARVPLAMSVLVGVGFTRYVLEAPAVCEPGVDELVARLTPALEAVLG